VPEIRLTAEEMRYIALFQDITMATAKDCIIDNNNNRIIFLVKEGQAGLAIGRGGSNVKRLNRLLGKDIEIVEYSEDFETLVKNIFAPARVRNIKLIKTSDGRKRLRVTVEPRDKGLAIGRGGRNIAKARLILKRYYDIDEVVID